MPKRSYNQYCAVARALDVLGERWTLLLIRELLLGPKRYGDLLAASPGIGTNLLAERLREMEAQGLVERAHLPPPAGSAVYQLTKSGADLEDVVRALGRWGQHRMGPRRDGESLSTGAYFVALRERFRPEKAAGHHGSYEIRVDTRVFEVRVEDGKCLTREGSAHKADAVFTLNAEALNRLFLGESTAAEMIADGSVQVEGDPAELDRFQKLFAAR